MKFGFDIHGVLDTHSEIYAAITQALVAAGHEVHVITGAIQDPELTSTLAEWGIEYTHWFSIAQYHMDRGVEEVRWVDGQPWMDEDVWDRTKADYCNDQGISLLIDDSPIYGQFFDKSTVYLLQKDPRKPDFWAKVAGLFPSKGPRQLKT